jgi:fused signal recognition particle receptor
MAELGKVRRVLDKRLPGAPHETLLVLDATTGQNAIRQAEVFTQVVPLTGVILAKLDGTARGGAVVSIRDRLGIPVRFAGTGEKADDLEPFDPERFLDALLQE